VGVFGQLARQPRGSWLAADKDEQPGNGQHDDDRQLAGRHIQALQYRFCLGRAF
jgi:hypothetical protein